MAPPTGLPCGPVHMFLSFLSCFCVPPPPAAFNHILTDVSLVVYGFESIAGFSGAGRGRRMLARRRQAALARRGAPLNAPRGALLHAA